MRRRLAVTLIAVLGVAVWVWYKPEPPPSQQRAHLSAVLDVPRDAPWIGGMSGIDVSEDGTRFHLVTDRGDLAEGSLIREQGRLAGLEFTRHRELTDRFGAILRFPHTDAEGIAVDRDGTVYVSFERANRVLHYEDWEAAAKWPSYTRAWRALGNNAGLECVAISSDGTLYVIPEGIHRGASEALVYLRPRGGKWRQAFTVPVDRELKPVGADFGPDGKFYLLERGLYPFGFYSRVRVMTVGETGVDNIETVLHTRLGRHGNLEGLGVWRDSEGRIRLTMVSDDNFYPFMRSQVVEYVLEDGLAKPPQ